MCIRDSNSVVNTAQGFGSPDVTPSAMNAAIKEWFGTYFRQEAGDNKDPCKRLAYTIVHKLDKGVFAEYKSDILDKEKTSKGAGMDANQMCIRDSRRGVPENHR